MTASSSAAGRPRLTILTPPLQGRTFIIAGQSAVIGRHQECEVILDQPSISRQHARISEENGRFVIRDLDSRNGITVAGQSVQESLLQHGDMFTVGDVQFKFEVIGASGVAASPARSGPPAAVAAPRPMPAIPPGWQPVAQPSVPPDAAPEQGGSAKLNVKIIVAAAAGLLLAIAAGAFILSATGKDSRSAVQLPPILVKVGESRWLALGPLVRAALNRKDTPSIEIAGVTAIPDYVVSIDTKIAESGEIVVTGMGGGEADIRILTTRGNTIAIRALVRGRQENSVEELLYAPLDESERYARAHIMVEVGETIQKDNPYLAQQQFERALALLSQLTRRQDYQRAKKGLDDAKGRVDAKWAELLGNIRVALNTNDAQRAIQLLNEALKLIPDENDWRHQKAAKQLQSAILQQLELNK